MSDLEAQYRIFKDEVRHRGYHSRTYGRYALLAIFSFGGIFLSLYFITITDNLLLQILNACFLTFVSMQAGMLGHDLSHGQVFESKSLNRSLGMIVWGLAGGLSEGAWYAQHNAHHEHVNRDGHDPDMDLPFFFSETQSDGSITFPRALVRRQHILFFLIVPIAYFSTVVRTWISTAQNIFTVRGSIELVCALTHFVVLGYLLFTYLPPLTALVFFVVHMATAGIYMAAAFAPNHKGEEIVSKDTEITWLHQITSTRNLYPSVLGFHVLGGLNFQIEHHLFPGVPRYQYPEIQKMVKKFCTENGIRYHETTWISSMKEIYTALKVEAARR